MTDAPRRPALPGWDLTFARLVLAGIFAVSAYAKISDPQSFATAIKAFQIVQAAPGLTEESAKEVMAWLAFLVPWIEGVCALALVLGFWARAAALVLFVMLAGFAGALASIVLRGMDVDCQCFGEYFGDAGVTWMSVLRNVVFMAVAAPVLVRGAGLLAFDTWWARRDRDGS